MVEIIEARSPEQIDAARVLFREYEAWLGLDLCFQGFEDELASLPGRYASPEGRLFLAGLEGKTVGCIALRRLEEKVCEMKRLYVRAEAHGRGIGIELIEKLLDAARETGYERMRLDTFPDKMGRAVDLYSSLGFVQIPGYYDAPHDGVIFMELDLSNQSPAPNPYSVGGGGTELKVGPSDDGGNTCR